MCFRSKRSVLLIVVSGSGCHCLWLWLRCRNASTAPKATISRHGVCVRLYWPISSVVSVRKRCRRACWRTHSRFRLSWVCQEQPDFIAAARQRVQPSYPEHGGQVAHLKIGQFKRASLIEEEAGAVLGTALVENSLAILRA
ncbi:hypothetical protein MRX96_006864 [Rhipicephalus microplus]